MLLNTNQSTKANKSTEFLRKVTERQMWKLNKKPINCTEKPREYLNVKINEKAKDNFSGIEF